METKQIPTLYEWVGGIGRLESLFMRFYSRVPDDPILAPVFAHMSAEHFRTVAHFVGEVLGGPALYSGDGIHGHSTMVAEHLGRHLTSEQVPHLNGERILRLPRASDRCEDRFDPVRSIGCHILKPHCNTDCTDKCRSAAERHRKNIPQTMTAHLADCV
jgi:Bacterial-like globin